MGAQFASSVEAATEVSRSEACHKARSPAKNTPAQKNIGSRQLRSVGVAAGGLPAGGGAAERARASSTAHTASSGSAKAPRQNAVAVGPVSDSRTKMPELPIASAPANSATSAGTSDASWRAGMGGLRTAHLR